jgi:tape measure domain
MEQFGKRMESIGSDLTTRLSLPLAGVGAAAVAAFADFERLSLGLNAVMGSAEAAEAEMAKLQESAKLPGLGFQEAVRGSIRLQAVGLSADEARGTLEAFGAAIAATGGSAQNLDSVQYQLTQMISKNRILQEDFGILQENVPLLGKAVQNAFGTANIEKIRATGISAEEFNRRIVAALQALPEVQAAAGGLGNAFDNFRDSLNFSLVSFGEAINRALNLESILNTVSEAVDNLAELFTSLSPTTQKVIVVIAALAAAIGPVLFSIGAIVKIIPLLTSGFALLTGPIGLAVIGITALAAVLISSTDTFRKYQTEASKAAAVQSKLAEVSKEAESRAADQKTQVDILVSALKKENISYQEKQRILNELKTISPEYFGNLKNTATAATDAEKAQKAFNDELLRTIQIEVAREKLVELERQLQNVAESAKPTIWQGIVNSFKAGGNAINAAAANGKTYADNIANATAEIEAQRQALLDLINTEKTRETATGGGGGGGGEGRKVPILLQPNAQQQQKVFDKIEQDALARFRKPKAVLQPFEFEGKDPVKETETVLADYSKAIADADAKARIFGTDTQTLLQEKLNITSGILSEGVEKFGENSLVVETLTGQYNGLAASLDAVAERQALIAKYQEVVGKAFDLAASRINESGLSIKTLLSSVVDAVRNAVVEFVRLKIVEAVASFIADSFKKVWHFRAWLWGLLLVLSWVVYSQAQLTQLHLHDLHAVVWQPKKPSQ